MSFFLLDVVELQSKAFGVGFGCLCLPGWVPIVRWPHALFGSYLDIMASVLKMEIESDSKAAL